MGSDQILIQYRVILRVSIHAPAWGATPYPLDDTVFEYVSIHAPAWGATCQSCKAKATKRVFQSTLPHGERLENNNKLTDKASFNPRSRMGSD